MRIANTQQHLQRLKQARLVIHTRVGQIIRYALSNLDMARL